MSANHLDRAHETMESVFDGIGKRVEALNEKTRQAGDEAHQTLDIAERVINEKLIASNNKLRGFLGMNSNFQPAEGDTAGGRLLEGTAVDVTGQASG